MIQDKLQEAVAYIRSKTQLKPKVGLILGSGFSSYIQEVQIENKISYEDIPHFHQTSVEGHPGNLITCQVQGVPLAILQGRIHYYEGHPMERVVFPTRTLAMLGIETLILTNAAGGLDPQMKQGDLMIISDHINLMGDNPLKGPNLKNLGPRFPDLSEAYDRDLVQKMKAIMEKHKISHDVGVYCAVSGPTYETPAEVKYLRTIGGNAVGMSTVPETVAANHLGLRVAAISCITNVHGKGKVTHDEVTSTAASVQKQFCLFLNDLILSLKVQ